MRIARCIIRYLDDGEELEDNIVIGKPDKTVNDDDIFYYCENNKEFKSLFKKENGGEFYIVEELSGYYEIEAGYENDFFRSRFYFWLMVAAAIITSVPWLIIFYHLL